MTQPGSPTGGPLPYESYQGRPAPPTSPLLVLIAWLVVGVPAAWGVEQMVMKSLALFRNAPTGAPLTAPSKSASTAPVSAPATAPASSGAAPTAPMTEPASTGR